MGNRTYTWDHGCMPRPATGKTPVRNLRVSDAIWKPALAKAKGEGRSLTEVIIGFLRQYIADQPEQAKPPERAQGAAESTPVSTPE